MSSSEQGPEVLHLSQTLGRDLSATMQAVRERDMTTALQMLLRSGESYRALSNELNVLAERILHKVALESSHREQAGALATAMISGNIEMLNVLLGEMRMRALTEPEEAHLTLVATLELLGFLARMVAEEGLDPAVELRQAIAARNGATETQN